ncbi:MAG TPA: hypothetical protein VMN38_09070 [Sphingomicrobium sp.]|nr:hypothetical protein [Sphingomicrobium sp.]
MRRMLLGLAAPLAALAVPAAPAAALDPANAQFTATTAAGVTVHRGKPGGFRHDGGDRDRDHRRGDRGGIFIYDRDWQGDTAWRATSYNDWWHERPWRSYPRWVSNNQGCERMWQGGGVWRCSW